MELALGTVQFGMNYGLAEARRVEDADAARILDLAWEAGVRRLDTAPGYGDIESRLASLCSGHPFSIVSKIPVIPNGLDAPAIGVWLRKTVETSRRRLGDRLRGLIFHDASLTCGASGAYVRETIAGLLEGSGISCGASHYDGATIASGDAWPEAAMAQVPGNAFDRRLLALGDALGAMEVSLRSVFLQGLLLMDVQTAAARLPAAEPALRRWREWCIDQGLRPLDAALAIAKGFDMVDFCLVGVDNEEQMRAIRDAWANAAPKVAPILAVDDLTVIDPRRWTVR